MGLGNLGRFIQKFARDTQEVTQGFERVFGKMPEPVVNSERAGRRAEMDSPRFGANILDREPKNKTKISLKKRDEPIW